MLDFRQWACVWLVILLSVSRSCTYPKKLRRTDILGWGISDLATWGLVWWMFSATTTKCLSSMFDLSRTCGFWCKPGTQTLEWVWDFCLMWYAFATDCGNMLREFVARCYEVLHSTLQYLVFLKHGMSCKRTLLLHISAAAKNMVAQFMDTVAMFL